MFISHILLLSLMLSFVVGVLHLTGADDGDVPRWNCVILGVTMGLRRPLWWWSSPSGYMG